jgi:rod shape-determining protein MreD
MSVSRQQGNWLIVLSFIAAFLLTLAPMPEWVDHLRPQWLGLVLIYWCLTVPERVGVGTGWTVGLLQDVAQSTLLGQHALAMALVGYVTVKAHMRLRLLPLWQQTATVLLFLLINQITIYWIDGISGFPPTDAWYLAPALTSTLLWPWLVVILRDLRRRLRIL